MDPESRPAIRDALSLLHSALAGLNLVPYCIEVYVRGHLEPLPLAILEAPPEKTPSPLRAWRPTPFQTAILIALAGKAMRSDPLGKKVGSRRNLYKHPGGLLELRQRGLLRLDRDYGYYRPDAPPPELSGDEAPVPGQSDVNMGPDEPDGPGGKDAGKDAATDAAGEPGGE